MMTRTSLVRSFVPALALVLSGACGGDSASGPLGGALTVSGNVIDFETNMPVTGSATVSAIGLTPTPATAVNGATFSMTDVPENSTFQILASVPPTHRATYSPAVVITNADVDNVTAYAVKETFLSTIASGFSVTPSAANGILLIQLRDAAGNAKAGVTAANIVLAAAGANGPHFLDANLAPTNATSSSASGWAVFFEVPPGVASLGTAVNATQTLAMATSPIGAANVTVAFAAVTDGAPPGLPTNVSLATQVFPIFKNRGCVNCHSGNGPGRDLGQLTLDGSPHLVFKELTTENPLRVQLAMPEKSLVLTMPSAESPPDAHPNVTFTGPQDPDYLKILVWIREGAKEN